MSSSKSHVSHLRVGGTSHVAPVDLNDLVPGLQPPVARHEAIREDLLDHDTAEGRVRPPHDGHPQARARPRDLHVGHLAFQDGQPRDSCSKV